MSIGLIGFIGLGNMGGHMARNLLKKGRSLVVFDVSESSVSRFLSSSKSLPLNGASVNAASSPSELAKKCRTIITMLPSSPNVLSVYVKDSNSILSSVHEGSLLIDSSTIDPHTSRMVASLAESAGCQMVDAPVSGGVGGAEAGTLTFMVGGNETAFNSSKEILFQMGKNVVHCGGVGSGQIAKVCNNLVLGISMAAVAEGMNLGVQLGCDPSKLSSIFNTSSARCWSSDTYHPVPGVMANVPSSRGYTGGFGTDLMKKDLGLAEEAAKQIGVKLHLGEVTHRLYQQISEKGKGTKDFSYIYQHLKEMANEEKKAK